MKKRIKVPNKLTVAFGRELVEYLGGDPAPIKDGWCWEQFIRQYPDLVEPAIEIIKDKMSGWNIGCLLRYQPQLVDKLDLSKMNGEDIRCLLCDQPQLVDKLDLDKMDGLDIYRLLCGWPQFIDKLNLDKMSGQGISWLLCRQPQLAGYFKDR